VGFVVGKVALGQVYLGVLRFSPDNFIPPLLHYTEKRKELSLSSQGCTISLKVAVGPKHLLRGPSQKKVLKHFRTKLIGAFRDYANVPKT
jgi:hypothetical protein